MIAGTARPPVADGMDADRLQLADPAAQHGDLPALWQRLRATAPVHRNVRPDGEPFLAVLTYADTVALLKDPDTFRSNAGMRLDADEAAVAAASRGRMLIVTDPPSHGKLRQVIGAAFTPAMTRRLEQAMTTTATGLIRQAVEQGTCDLTEVIGPLPASVICDILGVPEADRGWLVQLTTVAWSTTSADADERAERQLAHTEIMAYFDELAGSRRRQPADDLISVLVTSTVDGEPLTDVEVVLNLDGILSGGNETTRHAAVGGLLAFARHPEQWARLQADPGLARNAVQEVLRMTSPVLHVVRTASRDATVGGVPVATGERVAAWLPSANRDEQVFADPETFDIGRMPNRHLAFSHGSHHCLGSALAVAELTALFGVLVDQVRAVEPVGEPRRLRSNLVWGYESVPVRLIPSGRAGR